MNTLSRIAVQSALVVSLLLSIAPKILANNVSDTELEDRVESLYSSVDVRFTKEVKKRIKQYTDTEKNFSAILLGKVNIYFPLFEEVLREKGIPDDIKYLAIIESGLNPHATSRAGAAGLWQFMKATARMQGLKVSRYIDERRDPFKSTYAAADYLEYLHDKFGDWTLALAAYNCGPGNVRKAIRRSGGHKDFWKIKRYLPRETRGYIPKFIAMSYVMNYYYEHGIHPEMPHEHLLDTYTAQIFDKVSLQDLSKELSLDYKVLKQLNPMYVRGWIPSRKKGVNRINLPKNAMMQVMEKYDVELLTPFPVITPTAVESKPVPAVTKKEVLQARASIALEDIHVPIVNEVQSVVATATHMTRKRRYIYDVLSKKESLATIAQKRGIDIRTIIALNGFSPKKLPVVGDLIRIGEVR